MKQIREYDPATSPEETTTPATPVQPTFSLIQDGETLIFEFDKDKAMFDWKSTKEPEDDETFFDWCKNTYPYTDKDGNSPIENGNLSPNWVQPTTVQYEGKIKNITKGRWYGGTSQAGRPIHSKDEKNAVIFWEEAEAESELAMLNKYESDCYTLFDNVTPIDQPTTVGELPGKIEQGNGWIKFHNIKTEEIEELVRRYNAFPELERRNNALYREFESLTPGGSEFWNDVSACKVFIKRERYEMKEVVLKLKEDARQLQEQNKVLLEALKEADKQLNKQP